MLVNIELLVRIDVHIRREATGGVQDFAQKMGLSRRHLFRYIEYLRDDCCLSIGYCKKRQTYYYTQRKVFILELGRNF
ncbi:MAG: hypothetical protein NW226_27200 [Microscillaceae bacterium]|nr:hypothetical protein [Microscillaceae bacterium]